MPSTYIKVKRVQSYTYKTKFCCCNALAYSCAAAEIHFNCDINLSTYSYSYSNVYLVKSCYMIVFDCKDNDLFQHCPLCCTWCLIYTKSRQFENTISVPKMDKGFHPLGDRINWIGSVIFYIIPFSVTSLSFSWKFTEPRWTEKKCVV